MWRSITLCATALILSGCASKPIDLAALAAMPVDEVCQAYFLYHGAGGLLAQDAQQGVIQAELIRRSSVSAEEWPEIDRNKVRLGMRRCAVLAAWGKPDIVSESAATKFHFVTLGYNTGRFALLQDGIVTSVTAPPR